jgi:hypothetical protein
LDNVLIGIVVNSVAGVGKGDIADTVGCVVVTSFSMA